MQRKTHVIERKFRNHRSDDRPDQAGAATTDTDVATRHQNEAGEVRMRLDRLLKLPRRTSHGIRHRNVAFTMRDGVTPPGDIYLPAKQPASTGVARAARSLLEPIRFASSIDRIAAPMCAGLILSDASIGNHFRYADKRHQPIYRRIVDTTFKRPVVQMIPDRGRRVTQICRDMNPMDSVVRRWWTIRRQAGWQCLYKCTDR